MLATYPYTNWRYSNQKLDIKNILETHLWVFANVVDGILCDIHRYYHYLS
mgnify:FL=1